MNDNNLSFAVGALVSGILCIAMLLIGNYFLWDLAIDPAAIPPPILLENLSNKATLAFYEEIVALRSMSKYMQVLAPVAILLFVTLGGTLGRYFVKAQVSHEIETLKRDHESKIESSEQRLSEEMAKNRAELTKRLDDALSGQTARIDESKRDLESRGDVARQRIISEIASSRRELKEELHSELEAGVKRIRSEALQGIQGGREQSKRETLAPVHKELSHVYYAIASFFWRNEDYEIAAGYSKRAISHIDLFLEYEKADENRNPMIAKRVSYLSDLGYYFAEYFLESGDSLQATEALRVADEVLETLNRCESRARDTIVDNYLFSVAASHHHAGPDRLKRWLDVYDEEVESNQRYLGAFGEKGRKHDDLYKAVAEQVRTA